MKLAFATDEHAPFHDPRARKVALEIVADFQPDILVVGSDGIDFYAISHFDRDPARLKAGGLQAEIDAWKANQREWADAAGEAVRWFIPGNHEDRLRKYLWRHPELYGLEALDLPNLLALEELGIGYDDSDELVVDNLVIKHGEIVRSHSAVTARAELENERHAVNVITGHTHRGGSFFAQTRSGPVQAHEGFCLCGLEPDYVRHPNWQQGILLATLLNGVLSVEPVLISGVGNQKRAVWRGKEYRT